MTVFKDSAQLYDFYEELIDIWLSNEEIQLNLEEYNITIKFVIIDLEAYVFVGPGQVLLGEDAKNKEAKTVLETESTDIHNFWLKKINIATAMVMKKIKVRGSVDPIMEIAPLMEIISDQYPEYCRKNGIPI
jgi:putative sterol carrier protein